MASEYRKGQVPIRQVVGVAFRFRFTKINTPPLKRNAIS